MSAGAVVDTLSLIIHLSLKTAFYISTDAILQNTSQSYAVSFCSVLLLCLNSVTRMVHYVWKEEEAGQWGKQIKGASAAQKAMAASDRFCTYRARMFHNLVLSRFSCTLVSCSLNAGFHHSFTFTHEVTMETSVPEKQKTQL